jgi:glucokinase
MTSPRADEPLAPVYIGADIGGTKMGMLMIDSSGRVLKEHQHPTESRKGAEGVLRRLTLCVQRCFAEHTGQIAGLGVGVAGQVDPATGAVIFAPNLEWSDVPLAAHLREALRIPVFVTNDVRAATLGEWVAGAGRGAQDLVVVLVGTGIGGGVVSGGRLLTGASNSFGEVGHVTVVVDGRECRCGNLGCVEAYAGGWAIGQRARELVAADPAGGAAMLRHAGTIEDISAASVTSAYRDGDAMAHGLVDDAGRHLAAAAIGYINALNPARLILGGGVLRGLPELVDVVERAVRERALAAATETLEVKLASLGAAAAAVGAATLARTRLAQG